MNQKINFYCPTKNLGEWNPVPFARRWGALGLRRQVAVSPLTGTSRFTPQLKGQCSVEANNGLASLWT